MSQGLWPRVGRKEMGKNKDLLFTVRTEKTRLVRYLLYLYCVSNGFGNDFYSREQLQIFEERQQQNE